MPEQCSIFQTKQKTEKLKIKVKNIKPDDIKAPSIDETESVKSLTSPANEILEKIVEKSDETSAALPALAEPEKPEKPEEPKPTSPVKPPAESVQVSPEKEKKTPEESKENKTSVSTPKSDYNVKLSAAEVGRQHFVPRPSNRIATKNISFTKSKNRKPKYGKGSSPHPSDTERELAVPGAEGERRQLPSRRSRPQQLLDDEAMPGEDHLEEQENSNPPIGE